MKPKFAVKLTTNDGVLAIRLETTIPHGYREAIPFKEAETVIKRFAKRAGRKQTDAAKQVVQTYGEGHHIFIDTVGDLPRVVCVHDGIVKAVIELGGGVAADTVVTKLTRTGLLNLVPRDEIKAVLAANIPAAPLTIPGMLGAQRELALCFS